MSERTPPAPATRPAPAALPSAPRALAAGAALAALLGLASAGCAAFVDAPEYGVYRKARAARTLEDRLSASHAYLTAYPDGLHAPEVRAFFDRAEPLYFARARGSMDALETYLRALPKGPHAAEAASRLRDLRALDTAERTDLAGGAGAAVASVAREAERRAAVRERLGRWLGLFLDPAVFGAPLAQAKAELIVPWSVALPWPFCEATAAAVPGPAASPGAASKGGAPAVRCTKLLQLDYRAMEDGEPQEREALVEIAVAYDAAGRPLEVTLGGPELFLRLEETVTARGASSNDPEARLAGAERAVALAAEVFAEKVSADAACKRTADTAVAHLSCKGIELRVLAGALDGEDDRFVLRAAP